jgi:hypothetical protein
MSDDVASVNEGLKATMRLPAAPFWKLLADWTPVDKAMFLLGQSLGVYTLDDDLEAFRERVGSLWVNTPVGNALYDCLFAMYKHALLSRRHTEGHDFEFRWNKDR